MEQKSSIRTCGGTNVFNLDDVGATDLVETDVDFIHNYVKIYNTNLDEGEE